MNRTIRAFINAHLRNKDTGSINSPKMDMTNIVVQVAESGDPKGKEDSKRRDEDLGEDE